MKYKVVEEKIDLEALKQEKANLEAELEMKEPTKEELIEIGRQYHFYYVSDRSIKEKRIKEIDLILGQMK